MPADAHPASDRPEPADVIPLHRPHPATHHAEPEQLTFDPDWIDYWRRVIRTWAPLDRDQIDAIAAIVARIDQRRAATGDDTGSGPHTRPQAA
ncbi:hypothetical protein ACFYTQ_37450 [Nocardia sp. NPDC004068]|uniref:hypothetical protein n=1 Tax=Nocardia sp. NPDC004068 TaxID=3364303 RepID=UPI003686C196